MSSLELEVQFTISTPALLLYLLNLGIPLHKTHQLNTSSHSHAIWPKTIHLDKTHDSSMAMQQWGI